MNLRSAVLVVTLSSLALSGCALNGQGGRDYNRGDTRIEQEVRMGVVEAVREVKITAQRDSGVGTATGAVLGGIAGSHAGNGRGNVAGAVAGAVVGGMIGQAVERSNSERKGLEITIKLDSGKVIAITQEADEDVRTGDRVRILTARGISRVSRA